jgi:XTP/dITP diphosphohydrolase
MANNSQRIYLATGNAHKVQEFQQLAEVSALDVEFIRPSVMPVVIEDVGTFIGNARKKALALKSVLPADTWVLADDSGLCVDALAGRPGVESAYFAGPEGNPSANLAKLVDVMKDVPTGTRGAHFVCVLVLLGPEGIEYVCEGRCYGILRRMPGGNGGFGYDPLFIPDGFERTYAELSETEKNKISHRGRAWLILVEKLNSGKVKRLAG